MAFTTRKLTDNMAAALVAAVNLRQTESVGSFFHADTTQRTTGHYLSPVVADEQVASANGSSVPTNVTLANEIKALLNRHFADTLAHNTAVSAAISTADASDDATSITLANAIKAAYNTHLSASNVHYTNDATNTTAATDATNTATCSTLLNELKGDINAHVVSAPLGAKIKLVPA
jgi:hypothetical protein